MKMEAPRLQVERGSVRLALLVSLSALGGISSVLIGYAGRFLSVIPGGGPVSGQLLSGLHVFWLVLSAVSLKQPGSATATGALKGLIETLLASHLGIFVFVISFLEGLVVDIMLLLFRRTKKAKFYLASGLSAASNVIVLQLFFISELPILVYVGMYLVSFISGAVLGGFLSGIVLKNLGQLLSHEKTANHNISNGDMPRDLEKRF